MFLLPKLHEQKKLYHYIKMLDLPCVFPVAKSYAESNQSFIK